ncbi:MAG: M13 family metallopeptidase [Pseudomonadota bacterium]
MLVATEHDGAYKRRSRSRRKHAMIRTLFTGAVFLVILVCSSACQRHEAPEDNTSLKITPAKFGSWGVQTEYLSTDITPGDNFYQYVNDGWLRMTSLPPGRSSLSALNVVAQETRAQSAEILETAIRETDGEVRQQRVGNLYRSYMNTENINSLGLSPLQEDLDAILAIQTHEAVAQWMAEPRSHAIVGISVWLDAKDTSRNLVNLDQLDVDQGVIGLSSRRAYISDDAPYPEHRAAYREYIEQTLLRANIADSASRADELLALETRLADIMWTPAQQRDREANYNLMTVSGLKSFAPGFPWDIFLEARGVPGEQDIILGTDTAVQKSARIFADTPVEVWTSYLAFHWIDNHYFILPEAFDEGGFDFKGRALRGLTERSTRKDRAVRFVSRQLGHEIGQLYVQRHFSSASRERIIELVGYLRTAFDERLIQADWMDEQTRAEARRKLAHMTLAVGYPSVWKDLSGVNIDPTDPVGNYERLLENSWVLERGRLGKPYPAGHWWMNPQTVDASFSPQLNRITFPAGILQAPAFDPQADMAVNFGAIGAIIGHEMGHGFDDQGSSFNADGLLQNWWSTTSRVGFDKRADTVVEHYAGYEVWPSIPLNGHQTLGENIADIAGLAIAHRAYQLYLEDNPDRAAVIDGYTADQRFFMAWAQLNRSVWSKEGAREQALRSNHAPGHIRVNATVRHVDAWYEAFAVTPEHDLYLPPKKRIRFW